MNRSHLAALAKTHGTPFYVYDADATVAHLRHLKASLPDAVDVYYCLKANGNLPYAAAIKPHVDGLDISSGGELEMALSIGYDPQRMSFAGPGKSDGELEAAVKAGVGIVSVESLHELTRLGALSCKAGKVTAITIRVNPLQISREFSMKMGGQASQFGVPEEDAPRVVEAALKTEGVRVDGLHVFSGTQCLEAQALVENLQQTLDLATRLHRETGLPLRKVNLGGGFGVPYFQGQEPLAQAQVSEGLSRCVREFQGLGEPFASTRFLLELGRYIVGPFGTYVTRVLDIKETRGKRFVILDGGMNHCFPATGNFGQLVKKNYPATNISRPEAPARPQELVGPLCTPIDSMARSLEIPEAEIGDLVAFFHVGAYAFAASPLLFLSHPTPLELMVHQGEVKVVRARKRALDFA